MTLSSAAPIPALAGPAFHAARHREVQIRYWGEGPDLVLLHGNMGSWTHWLRNIPVLARRYRVVVLDLPGFGDSDDVPTDLAINRYLDWAVEAILSATTGCFSIAGFSFGAVVAAAAAPQLKERLICASLAAPGGFGTPAERQITILPVRREAAHGEERKRAAAIQNLRAVMLTERSDIGEDAIDAYLDNIDHSRFDGRKLSWLDRIEDDLKRMPCAVQLIWGEEDQLCAPSLAARVDLCRAARADARIDLIPAAAHWVQYEQADLYNDLLQSFLDAHIGSAGKEGGRAQ